MLLDLIHPSTQFSSPPQGSINVRVGQSVVGSGGAWIPCVTRKGATYFASLFQVGPGQRQVCAVGMPLKSADAAFSKAVEFATFAAA